MSLVSFFNEPVNRLDGLYTAVGVRYHCGGWSEEVNSCVLNSYMVSLGYYLHRQQHLCTHIQVTIYMAQSPCFLSPLADSLFAPPFSPLYLLGNPPSCERIRPPWSQVACKLTFPFSTLSQSLPPPNSQYPGY